MSQSNEASLTQGAPDASSLGLLFDLFKLRIGLAIGLAALAGIAITPGQAPSILRTLLLVAAVTLTSAAAGAFNQYVERDLDAQMRRTRGRVFVTGRFSTGPEWLIAIGILALTGVTIAAFAGNAASAIYTFLGAFTYGVVYTLWLKRRTWWNIVVGGLAGSFAVLAGAAAVVATQLTALPLTFAVILFLWTPPHFWSLAIAYRDDYAAAKVPMLPVVVGNARAARAVFTGTVLLVAATLVPIIFGMGWLYLTSAISGGTYLLTRGMQLARKPGRRTAMACFRASLLQLTVLLLAAIADRALHR